MYSEPQPSNINSLSTWRLHALNWILRGQLPFWLLAYLAGVWNAVQTYQEKSQASPTTPALFILAILTFTLLLIFMGMLTFTPQLGYRIRIFALLGIYHALSIILFALSALSGDARGFLFAFVVLAAILLDSPWNIISLAIALLTYAVMGLLHILGYIRIAAEYGYNATDPSAWLSGGIVFAALCISASLGITYLLRSLATSLTQSNNSLQNELRASNQLRLLIDINQLIVRERQPKALLDRACQIIIQSGYYQVWVALLLPHETTLEPVAYAGVVHPAEPLPEIAAQSMQGRCPIFTPSLIAFPILRPQQDYGVLVIARTPNHPHFGEPEINLFQELANDLAYALENNEAETQRRAIAETAAPLLTAREETQFWAATLNSVQTILHADRAAIYIYEYGTDRLVCPYSTGLSQAYIDEINRRFRETPGSRLLRDPQPVLVNHIESNPLAAPLRPILQQEGIRSYVVFPLFSAEKILGAFVAYRSSFRIFSQQDLEAGQTLAHLIAASLQNTRLFTETRIKAAEQAALFIAAQEISASLLNPPALLETLAKQCAIALNATSVYVGSFDPIQETFTVLAEYWSESASPTERKSDLGRVYPAQDYPHVVQSMISGKVVTLQDDEEGLTKAESDEYSAYGAHTKLFVPLLAQGQLVGYTEIWESRHKREFTLHEIHLAQALSSHAASVIYAANLFAELEKRESYFRALTENYNEGVAVLNEDGQFTFISQQEEKMLGYPLTHVMGKYAFEITHPDDVLQAKQQFEKITQQADSMAQLAYRARHADGTWRWIEVMFKNLLQDPNVHGVVVNFRDITDRKQAEASITQAYDSTLEGWARALELRDKETEGHTRRVTELAVRLAHAMNLPADQIIHLRRGAILHDIGKMAIPDRILHKPSTLTPVEMDLMRQHPRYAYEMLSSIEHLLPALDIPYCHHERWDGSGYPRGLKGAEIPLAARIFAIADVYDALTSNRPYRKAWKKEQAIAYLLDNAGVDFDPHIVKIFLAAI